MKYIRLKSNNYLEDTDTDTDLEHDPQKIEHDLQE